MALKEMTKRNLGEIMHKDWIKACNHMMTIEEQYWHRDELMEEAIENIIVNKWIESSDKEFEIVRTCSQDNSSSTDTRPEETDSSVDSAHEGPEDLTVFKV
jgi:hypothetical protein